MAKRTRLVNVQLIHSNAEIGLASLVLFAFLPPSVCNSYLNISYEWRTMASSTESWTFSGSYSITCDAVAEAAAAAGAPAAVDEDSAGASAEPAASEPAAVLRLPFFFLVKGTLTASSIQ